MNPLRLTLILIIHYSIFHIQSQAQSYEWLSNDFHGSTFIDVIEVNGKVYGTVSPGPMFHYNANVDYRLSLYEIEFDYSGGQNISLTEVLNVHYPENYTTIAIDFIDETSSWIIVQSYVITQGHQNYRVLLCNENFDVIQEQTFDTLGYPVAIFIDTNDSITYVLGSIIGPPRDEIFYLKYYHSDPLSLPPINIVQASPKPMFWITSMNIDETTSNMLVFYFNGIAVLDSNLYQVKRFDHFSHIKTYHHGSILDAQDHFYSHGAYKLNNDIPFRHLVLNRYDTSFNIMARDTLGMNDQDNYPFVLKSLDYRNNELLVGAHLDGPYNFFDVQSHVKKFYLAKYDLDLNQMWYKEFGGDRAYWFYGLHLLEDGGALAYGFITDTLDGQRYAYILHVNENGDTITSTAFPGLFTKIKVYSPGNEYITISNPDGFDAQIILYDQNGRELVRENLKTGITEINTTTLPPALYPYVIVNGRTYLDSGKWVKTN